MSCTRCNLYKTAQSICLLGQGPSTCDIMIVGEAPGLREDDLNKPFQGACGIELDQTFEGAGISRKRIYITNVVHCRPPRNRKPSKAEVTKCIYWLNYEIEKVKPKFILLLGAVALSAFPFFNDKGSLTQLRGKFYEIEDKIVMPTFHPGAILRDDRKKPIFETDLLRFFEATRANKFKVVTEMGLNLQIAKSLKDIAQLVREIQKERNYVSLDLETQGLSPFSPPEAEIKCIGIGLKKKQWIVPLYHPESSFKSKKIRSLIIKLLGTALSDKCLIFQNGKFDSLWLKIKYGVDFKIGHDTMMMSYLLDENSLNGLKYNASRFCGAPEYALTDQELFSDIELTRLAKYCALDVFYTRKLFFIFLKDLKEDPVLYRFYKKVIVPAINVYRNIEMTGIYIDEKRMGEAEKTLIKQVTKTRIKLNKYGNINWNSTQQIAKLLFHEIGLSPLDKTEGGDYSTSESVLKRLAKQHELPKLILKYREDNGLLTKFLTGWKTKLVNHKLYPSFKLHGTVTGRPSCEEPNLQQTPRDPRIRSLVIAPPGWILAEFDYGQIELRIVAMLANERSMKLAFQTGEDIHIKTAILISGKDMSFLSGFEAKEWRKKAKPVNFGFVYGMGSEHFIIYARDKYDIEFTSREAAKFRKAFFRGYPDLYPWYDKVKRIAHINGYVRNLAGRVRHLPDIDTNWQAELQAINSPVQGLASDFTLISVIEIDTTFPRTTVRVCGTVHDSILVLIKEDHLDKVIPQIKEIMESPALFKELQINPTVPIEVNVSVGPWGKGEDYNDK